MRRTLVFCAAAALTVSACCAVARAQCQLANPSFELTGQGGGTFDGWNQFGTGWASTQMVSHGQLSAALTGPYTGDSAVSGFWQPLDSAPGDQWSASVRVGHSSADPLTGDTRAILNIEWRDANGELVFPGAYESHTLADAATPTDTMQRVEIVSAPAPAGTVSTRLLLGVLQSPAQDAGTAFFDLVEFHNLTPPTIDDLQWGDFPGGRSLDFSGRSWRVKGPGYYGPGPSLFADSESHVWVDGDDHLHMTIRNVGGSWYSTEIAAEEPLGYGDYIFTTIGRLDTWAPNVVLGLFLWQYPLCWDQANPWNLHNEFDIEISRWGTPGNDIGQFVVQPWEYPGNISRFAMTFSSDDELTSIAYRWLPDRIEARSWHGPPEAEAPGTLMHTWTYTGPHIPRPEQPRVHFNFWQFEGPPSNGLDHEVVFEEFRFVPACADELDESDYPCFAACFAGPDAAIVASCAGFDQDADQDVDLADFAGYQASFDPP